MSLVRNFWLAAGTALNHIADDPVVLLLQLSRRLPASIVMPTAKGAAQVLARSCSAPALLASYVSGDLAGLERKFQQAVASVLKPNTARLAADVALGAGMPHWADKFLPAAESARRFPATLARRKWYDGNMSGAVAALTGQRGQMAKHHARLAGELLIFSGWRPTLSPVNMVPVSGRVLHFLTNSLPHTGSGYAQRSHSVLTAQQDAGSEILAVTRMGYPVQVGKVLAKSEDKVDGVTYRRLIPTHMAKTADARLQQEAEELLKVALDFQPEVLHTTTHFTNGLVVAAVAQALGIPWVYEVRGQLADTWASTRGEEAKSSQRYVQFQQREADVMNAADVVVTLGDAMKDSIVAAGIPARKVMLAPNAVGGAYLAEPKTKVDARKSLGLDPELDYIGTVSSLVDYEGIDHLIDAFAILAPEFPKLRLLIVGNGTSLPLLKDQANGLGLADTAIFTGRVLRDSAALYHQSLDVFVVPRKDLDVTRAVTPLKPVEALASGRPVIASDLPALREIVKDNFNGRLFPAGNIVELAGQLADLLSAPEKVERMGREGRHNVLLTRTWAVNAINYAKKYEELSGRTV